MEHQSINQWREINRGVSCLLLPIKKWYHNVWYTGNMSVLVLYKCIGPFVHFMVCWHIYWFTYIVFVSWVLVIIHLYWTLTETVSSTFRIWKNVNLDTQTCKVKYKNTYVWIIISNNYVYPCNMFKTMIVASTNKRGKLIKNSYKNNHSKGGSKMLHWWYIPS